LTKDLGMLGRHGAVLSASFRLVCSGACLTALVITPSPDAIAAQAATGRIVVSKNALVSGDRPKNEHGETVICASLSDPNLLIAGGMTTTNGGQLQAFGETTYQLVYSSRDGGKTWHHAFETLDRGFSPDAACAYGPDGSAHFSTMNGPIGEGQDYSNNPLKILDYRSPDGGKTWEPPVMLTGVSGADRQYMIFDNTGGRYHGRYYIAFNAAFNQRTVKDKPATGRQMYALSRSLDGGKTWDSASLDSTPTSKAHVRFSHMWNWGGHETILMSRAIDETGYVQPTRAELIRVRGAGTLYHWNPIYGWKVSANGRVFFYGAT